MRPNIASIKPEAADVPLTTQLLRRHLPPPHLATTMWHTQCCTLVIVTIPIVVNIFSDVIVIILVLVDLCIIVVASLVMLITTLL